MASTSPVSFWKAFFKSATNKSMSARLVSLPTLSLMAFAATPSGTPQARRMGEGLEWVGERRADLEVTGGRCQREGDTDRASWWVWQAAPTLAWEHSSAPSTFDPITVVQ